MIKIFPSLIAARQLDLKKVVKDLQNHCAGFHLDIMDNHFVPNLTWGHLIVNPISQLTNKQLWVHLMVDKPETVIERLTLKKDDIVSFHLESTDNVQKVADVIKKKNCIASLAIKPKTPLKKLFEHIKNFSHVLIMSVEPGFSGQQFIPDSIERVKEVADYIKKHNLQCTIGVDGGINTVNIKELAKRSVQDFAVGSAIFKHKDFIEAINLFPQ